MTYHKQLELQDKLVTTQGYLVIAVFGWIAMALLVTTLWLNYSDTKQALEHKTKEAHEQTIRADQNAWAIDHLKQHCTPGQRI